mmetsp:Transcript_40675/g.73285  ORF Transcript_40675/g.73285 Transcript_40675/m.73285 type:complete len:314 (+) Transcript_40675:43-984(+)
MQRSVRCLHSLKNRAFVFVKPHAAVPSVCYEVPRFLERNRIDIVGSGEVGPQELRDGRKVDQHYASIAGVALMAPAELAKLIAGIPGASESFASKFHKSLEGLGQGQLLNVPLALQTFGLSPEELKTEFNAVCCKLAPGIYVAELHGRFVVNGFYGRLREKFVAADARIVWFLAEFDAKERPWKAFREEVIGATDPSLAKSGSLRSLLLERWKELGLTQPDKQDNAIHASASPLEALREEQGWTDSPLSSVLSAHHFGLALLEHFGVPAIEAFLENPTLRLKNGREGPAFDLLEDTDTSDAVELLLECRTIRT